MNGILCAGYSKTDITPKQASVPLGGFGASEFRLSAAVIDPLYARFVALQNGDELCLYVCMDLVGIPENCVAAYRTAIREATGLREDRIFLCANHTHSGPDMHSPLPAAVQYRESELTAYLLDGAKRALADLKPAKLSYGSGEAGRPGCRLTFDRHYYAVRKEKKDNYKPEDLVDAVRDVLDAHIRGGDYCAVQHKEEADHSILLMRFKREGADDILLINFSAHSTFTGGSTRPEISSDYSGALIERVEELVPGTKCAFLQGCCGNLVPATEIEEEGIWGVTYPPRNVMGFPGTLPKVIGRRPWHKSHYAYGDLLAGYVFKILTQSMKESETEVLAFRRRIHAGKYDHSKDALVPQAKEALKIYEKEGHTKKAYDWCRKFGLGSVYACGDIVLKSGLPDSGEIELNAIRIGDCAITTLPFEPFASTGQHVKRVSPFVLTVANGYSCGYQSYLTTKNTHPLSYEAYCMLYEVGTAETIEDELIDMLRELKD